MADSNLNSNHKLDEAYNGNTLLRIWWPKVKSNFSGLYTWLMEHINGTADRHKAEDIDYDESTTVRRKIDDFHQTFMEHINGTADRHKADDIDYDENTTVRQKIDDFHQTFIDVSDDIYNVIEDKKTELQKNIDKEVTARQNADNRLQTNIDTKADKITNNGFAAGGADNADYGVAIGDNASTTDERSVALGSNASANYMSVAIGPNAKAVEENNSVAIGSGTEAGGLESIAIGDIAKATAECSVQIGTGTNNNENTLQYMDYQITDIDGGTKYLKDVGKLSNLATTVKMSIVGAVNEIFNKINAHINGKADRHTADNVDYNSTLTVQDFLENLDNATDNLNEAFGTRSELATTVKTSLVGAVNEIFNKINTHINGEADRHTADNIDYNSTLTVQDFLENLDNATTRTDEILDTKADKKTATNGFVGGNNAEETGGGAALGNYAKTTSGGAVGSEAESKNGFAGGYNAKATGMGACIGANSHAYHGGAVGNSAQAGNGFAGGLNAKCGTESNGADIDCIQLGTGTNGTAKTLQVYDKRIVEADGSLADVGNLSDLNTSDKTSIVNSINSIVADGTAERDYTNPYVLYGEASSLASIIYSSINNSTGYVDFNITAADMTVTSPIFGNINLSPGIGYAMSFSAENAGKTYSVYAKYIIPDTATYNNEALTLIPSFLYEEANGTKHSYAILENPRKLKEIYVYMGEINFEASQTDTGEWSIDDYTEITNTNTKTEIYILGQYAMLS